MKLAFGFIAIVTVAIYGFSFVHQLRGETYTYLMDTQGHNSFWSLLNWWDYEKIRQFDPGDRWLFKPMLFVIAGFEKAHFGLDYHFWRILAFGFHLFAVWALFRLLWKIKAGMLAVVVTLLFATAPLYINTILYEQIAPYALFTGLILVALYYVYTNTRWYLIFGSLLVACFINEAGIVITVLIVAYLFWQKRKNWAIAGIIPVYLVFYLCEKLISPAPGIDIESRNIFTMQTLIVGLGDTPSIGAHWLKQLFVPANYDLIPQLNLRSYSAEIVSHVSILPLVFNILALIGIVAFVAYSIKPPILKNNVRFVALAGVIALIYVTVVSVFRANTHGLLYIFGTNFNAYMFSAWLLLFVFVFIVSMELSRRAIVGISLCLLVIVAIAAPKVFTLNHDIQTMETPLRNYLTEINDFVNQHKSETDFSFNARLDDIKISLFIPDWDAYRVLYQKAYDASLERDLEFSLWTVDWSTEPPTRIFAKYSIPQVMYWQYWSDNPKWILNYSPELDKLLVAINK